nr:hypothetical protein [uncultured Devosia sp.]
MAETKRETAERHEALWLKLAALHKDMLALGARKPAAPVSEPVRIEAEGLLSDSVPFSATRRNRLPVAAHDLAGLAVQLGQAIAVLEAWQSQHTEISPLHQCLMWDLGGSSRIPVMRLKPPAAAIPRPLDMVDIRAKLVKRIDQRNRAIYNDGFKAGLAARVGAVEKSQSDQVPAAEPEQTYPRVRWLG